MNNIPRRFGILGALAALLSIPRGFNAREIPSGPFEPGSRRSSRNIPKSPRRERAEAKQALLHQSSRMAKLIQSYRIAYKARNGVHCSYQEAGQALAAAAA